MMLTFDFFSKNAIEFAELKSMQEMTTEKLDKL